MFDNLFTGWHVVIILAVVLLLFGATKLPALAKGVGQSVRIFRSELNSGNAAGSADKDRTTAAGTDAVSPSTPDQSRSIDE